MVNVRSWLLDSCLPLVVMIFVAFQGLQTGGCNKRLLVEGHLPYSTDCNPVSEGLLHATTALVPARMCQDGPDERDTNEIRRDLR